MSVGAPYQYTLPEGPYGSTLGDGVNQFTDPTGEIEAVPYTGTPPYGEPPLWEATEPAPWPVDPPFDSTWEDDYLHEQIHGAPNRGYDIEVWVNPSNPGVPNLGPANAPSGQTGHTQNILPDPAAEQGWGLDPAIVNARYPNVQGANPYYASGTYRRNGQLDFNSDGLPLNGGALDIELQNQLRYQRSTTHGRLADVPQSVPYSSVVPVGGQAGPLAIIPEGDEAIY